MSMLQDLKRLNFGMAFRTWQQSRVDQNHLKTAREAFNAYNKEAQVKKIQFGSGANSLDGWLNTDANPKANAVFVDIKKTLPFQNESFDYAFSEHVFGYLNFKEAAQHLEDVFRILKKGGVYHIETPNLDLIQKDPVAVKDYYSWYLEKFKVPNDGPEAVYFLNHFFKIAYGTYFHNATSLKFLAQKNNWTSFKFFDTNQKSSFEALQNISHHKEVIGANHNNLETIIVELVK